MWGGLYLPARLLPSSHHTATHSPPPEAPFVCLFSGGAKNKSPKAGCEIISMQNHFCLALAHNLTPFSAKSTDCGPTLGFPGGKKIFRGGAKKGPIRGSYKQHSCEISGQTDQNSSRYSPFFFQIHRDFKIIENLFCFKNGQNRRINL